MSGQAKARNQRGGLSRTPEFTAATPSIRPAWAERQAGKSPGFLGSSDGTGSHAHPVTSRRCLRPTAEFLSRCEDKRSEPIVLQRDATSNYALIPTLPPGTALCADRKS